MLRSLVGSEMCIRDSRIRYPPGALHGQEERLSRGPLPAQTAAPEAGTGILLRQSGDLPDNRCSRCIQAKAPESVMRKSSNTPHFLPGFSRSCPFRALSFLPSFPPISPPVDYYYCLLIHCSILHSSVNVKLALCCATFRGLKLLCVARYSQCEHKKGVVDPKI